MAASSTNAIDLSQLPLPDVLEPLSYEDIYAQMKAALVNGVPDNDPPIVGIADFDDSDESDPAVKLLQVAAYFRMLDRQRVNDAAKALVLAYARGADLTHLGALMGVARLDGEDDDAYLERVQLAPDSFSVAGPSGSYEYFARSAAANVRDARAISPSEGQVLVSIMTKDGNGQADADLVAAVQSALDDASKRPLTDQVTVQSAAIVEYAIEATVYTYAGPDADLVLATAAASAAAKASSLRRIGFDVARTALTGAIHVAGVHSIVLTAPVADLILDDTQASFCTGVALTNGGVKQ
jgi:phage-related baseplate assembly protein